MIIKKLVPAVAIAMVAIFMGCSSDDSTPENSSPSLTTSDPENNAISVERNKVITIEFSEAMDPKTINSTSFSVMEGSNSVAGTVIYSGTTASFIPTNSLMASTTYTATLTVDAKNIAGIAIKGNEVWSFTTSGSVEGLSGVDLGTAGNYAVLAKTAINNVEPK